MPSKKVISIFILCSALVLTIIIVSNNSSTPPTASIKNVIGLSAKSPAVSVDDNPNWKQDVSGISLGVTLPKQEDATATDETLTDTFSRSFMANYLALKKSGPLSATDATNLINKSVEFINKTDTRKYGLADIIISPDNSKASLTKYGNDLGLLARTSKQAVGTGMEMAIYEQMVAAQSSDSKPKLIEISKSYKNLASLLAKITVPSSFSTRHLATVNALNAIGDSIVDLSAAVEDPTKSLRAIGIYKENYNIVTEQVRLTKVDLVKAGINYKQGENGYYFYFGI